MKSAILGLFLTLQIFAQVYGHARFNEPPSRSSMWRFGFDTTPDYSDNQGFCGGFQHQFGVMGGKCGICGDAYDDQPRQHETHKDARGMFAKGIIVRNYTQGQVVDITIDVTANHKGYFVFKICPNNNIEEDPDQECFDKNVLKIHPSGDEKYTLPSTSNDEYSLQVKLPNDMYCDQCIIQWTYVTGNNWGVCENGQGAIGCGDQEHFRSCSDVAILRDSSFPPKPVSPANPSKPDTPPKTSTTTTEGTTTTMNSSGGNGGKLNCKGIAPRNTPDYDDWCNANCNNAQPFCPQSFCHCQPAQ